ncbi:hypothetical protein [Legionella micdadei]|uniref:Uncharacterized protein n=1 Tax=Legionella micdadei TaxID=451 RepID=A0A098GFL3_LEGMI|nr:hypothetical protein [Legionella micdadei]ARG98081.1 hypothetical protein B6N58_10655 [Legionella micdadei]ARH00878.1 hypothetical protein B6V88_10885 [Legionella micdadei]KTD30086.1 hypothetical protein Lmic_0267 [Legionella micdadei]NSL18539.1 hypothetical protein [Legionella micdadei]CEG60281.1 conserved membrane protein of unknown function [Legionella micdadei]
MLRQSLIYLLLSILVVVFARFAHMLLVYIDMLYVFINIKLTPIFSQGGLGTVIRKVILLVLIPVIIAAIPALSYRLVKGKEMPYFMELTWCLWLVVVLSNVLIHI